MSDARDPYAPPSADLQRIDDETTAHAEAVREEHLRHERAVRSVGTLYYLGAVLMIAGAIGEGVATDTTGPAGLMVFYTVFAAIAIVVGRGLRKLRSWVRIPAVILSVIGLLGFPIGTLINGYILYLILSAKGKMVLSAEYQDIMQKTPHIKYRTSWIAWAILIVILVGILAAVLIPAFS